MLSRPAAAPPPPAARSLAGRWAGAVLSPSPASMRRIALAGVVASAAIILTGAAVRLSQSGLGCPDWPACTSTSLGAGSATGGSLIHQWIEFGNRLVTVAIFVVAVLVWVAGWRFTDSGTGRRRRDLAWLASAQPAAIVVQAALGGIVVLTNLNPVWVSVHFLASIALVAAAVALYVRCQEGSGPVMPLAPRELRLLAAGVVGVLALMLTAGTVVTGTGPLAGAVVTLGGHREVVRYHLALAGVTQLHADIGWLLAGLVTALMVGLRFSSVPPRASRLGWVLLSLIVLQGVVGYTQYFAGLPAGLVWVHVCGATLIWVTALLLLFSLRDRAEAGPAGEAAAPADEAAEPQDGAAAPADGAAAPAGQGALSGKAPVR